jgi:ketosteroid isomerase-like protein
MTTETQSTTEAVFAHHVQAVRDRDIEAIVSDYADGAVLMMPSGVVRGIEQIRTHFTNVVNGAPAELLTNLQDDLLYVEGEFVFFMWSSGSMVPHASDTLCIRDGKIILQTGVSWTS